VKGRDRVALGFGTEGSLVSVVFMTCIVARAAFGRSPVESPWTNLAEVPMCAAGRCCVAGCYPALEQSPCPSGPRLQLGKELAVWGGSQLSGVEGRDSQGKTSSDRNGTRQFSIVFTLTLYLERAFKPGLLRWGQSRFIR